MKLKPVFMTLAFCLVFFCHFAVNAENLNAERHGWELLNDLRTKHGLTPVSWNPNSKLQKAARVRAAEIEKLFSHTRPNSTSCFTVLKQMNISYRAAGENLAMGTNLSADYAMKLWTDSPNHFANMVGKDFSQVGIASLQVGDNVYWVQLFVGYR